MSFGRHRRRRRGIVLPAHLTTGSEEQGYVEDVFGDVGANVWRVANVKGSGGTPGVSDDLIFLPNRRILLAWDSKTGRAPYERRPDNGHGYLTDEQAAFGALMQGGFRTAFGFGDRHAALKWLKEAP